MAIPVVRPPKQSTFMLSSSTPCRAEFFQQLFERRRSAKAFDAKVVPFGTGVLAPAKIGCHFHRHSGLHAWRQNRFTVALILIIKQLPRRHADYSRPHALLTQLLVGLKAERDLAAGADENDFRGAAEGVRQNIGATRQARGGSVFRPIDRGQGLASEHEHRWLVMQLQYDLPSLGH